MLIPKPQNMLKEYFLANKIERFNLLKPIHYKILNRFKLCSIEFISS